MKSTSVSFIIGVLMIFGLPFSGAHARNARPAPVAAGLPHPYIYEIRSPGSSQISYLFGSLHYGFGTSELPSWVQRLHHDAEMNFYEIELDSQADFFMLQDFYFNPEKAAKELGIENSPETIAQLIVVGIPARIAPYFPAAWGCATAWDLKMFGLERPWRELDAEFEVESTLLGKTVHYLETEEIRAAADTQSTDPSPVCTTQDLIKDSVKANEYFDAYEAGMNKIREEFRSGVESAMHTADSDPTLVYRNHVWIGELTPQLKAHKSFVVVGAGHLFGHEGLIELLRAQGFQVRRVTQDPGGHLALTKGVGY